MRRLAAVLLGLGVSLLAGGAQAEKRVALVIGNGAYQNASQLTNPSNDANAMAAMFREAGFEVVEARTDLGNLEFKRVARDFNAVARDADVAVMYYAGHGIEVNGTNYLVPVDAKLATDFDVEDEALSLDRLMRALEPARRLRLIILDACRDNPFARGMQRNVASRAVATGLAKVEPANSDTLIAFAAKAGSTADDGRGANSPFTTALLKNLAVPGRDIRIALGYVRDDVVRATGSRQEPFVYGSLGGATVTLVPEKDKGPAQDISAAPPSQSLPFPQSLATPLGLNPRQDYEFAERVGTLQAWDSFLAVHKAGFYADLARAQRAKFALPAEPVAPAPRLLTEPVQPQAPIANIALLPPADRSLPSGPEPKPDERSLARDLQTELKRVGCDPGAVDGNWSPKSRQALDQFNRRAGASLDVKVATIGALDTVKEQRGRICPLICGAGQRVEGEQCVAIPAAPRPRSKQEAMRTQEPKRAAQKQPPNRPVRTGRPVEREEEIVVRGGPPPSGPPVSIGGGIPLGIGIGIGGGIIRGLGR